MEIKGINYRVWYDQANVVVNFEGMLQLSGSQGYAPIEDLLGKVLAQNTKMITLDIRALQSLNGEGINMLYKFAGTMRDKGAIQLVVRGSKNIPWHGTLTNLKKFNPNSELILVD